MPRSNRQNSKTVIGLNIEPGAVSVAEVSVNGSVRLERAFSAALDGDVVREGEVVDVAALSSALKNLWGEHKGLSRQVRVGVANARIVVRMFDVPPVTDRKEIEAAVRFMASTDLPMPIDQAVLDFEPLGLVETPDGPRQRVMLVAARRKMIETVMSAVGDAGLKVSGVDLSAFAMIRALGGAQPENALYLSIGGLANVAVVVDGVCRFTRVAGGGLESMAIDLAERRTLTLEHARMWLRHVGLGTPVEDIEGDAEIIADARTVLDAGTRRLATEVRTSLEFHHSQSEVEAYVDRVIFTGAAASVPGVSETLKTELGLEVEVRTVTAGKNVDADVDLAQMTVAAGLGVEEVGA